MDKEITRVNIYCNNQRKSMSIQDVNYENIKKDIMSLFPFILLEECTIFYENEKREKILIDSQVIMNEALTHFLGPNRVENKIFVEMISESKLKEHLKNNETKPKNFDLDSIPLTISEVSFNSKEGNLAEEAKEERNEINVKPFKTNQNNNQEKSLQKANMSNEKNPKINLNSQASPNSFYQPNPQNLKYQLHQGLQGNNNPNPNSISPQIKQIKLQQSNNAISKLKEDSTEEQKRKDIQNFNFNNSNSPLHSYSNSNSQEKQYICLKCLGKGTDENGNKCFYCNSTGKIDLSLINPFLELIRGELSDMVKNFILAEINPIKVALVEGKNKNNKKQNANLIMHNNIKCIQCNENPIIGIRYKCSICDNYDLCEKCEDQNFHEHPFIKIRNSNMKFKKIENPNLQHFSEFSESFQSSFKANQKYRAKVISTYPPDPIKVKPGALIIKSWNLKNEGDINWPKETLVIKVGGSNFGESNSEVGEIIASQEVIIRKELKAPSVQGNYNSFYRLGCNFPTESILFGNAFWVEIIVENEEMKYHNFQDQSINDHEIEAIGRFTELNDNPKYEENGYKLIHLGVTNIQLLLKVLRENDNNFEKAKRILLKV